MTFPPIKPPVIRSRLADWLWRRGYDWRDAGELFDSHGEAVRCWCLPFDSADYRRPSRTKMDIIIERTGGVIGNKDFDPDLRRAEVMAELAQEAEAAAARLAA